MFSYMHLCYPERQISLGKYVHLLDCFLIYNAVTPFSASTFLEKYEEEFFKVVNPKVSLLRLIRKGVITRDVRTSIDSSNIKDAAEILYDHLKCHGNAGTLKEYCEVAIEADGLPNMQALGKKMKKDLPPEVC